jgi:20S proteasome subunit alpha 3
VIVNQKRTTSKLLVKAKSEKMHLIDDHIACAVAGLTADANLLIDHARVIAARHFFSEREPQPVERMIRILCDTKQGYTQYGGLRPFGVSFLFAGWDQHFGFQLYHSDPSGNYGGWKATAIGNNHQTAKDKLKTDYDEGMDIGDALKLAASVLSKTMDITPTVERTEFATLTRTAGKISFNVLSEKETEELLSTVETDSKTEAK